jgi:predicted acylesterase/phospholipase RssA
MIKHIVISGGGHSILSFYGTMKESNKNKYWDYKNIESIYGSSAGSIMAVILSLNIDWELLDNYFLNRPWEKVFSLNFESLFSIFNNFGMFSNQVIIDLLNPLFKCNDIDINITIKELYDINHIDIHIITTELFNFESIDISHKTHPDWKVVDAVYASCAIPILFIPLKIDNTFYLDGGILNDYPIDICLKNTKNEDEIFAIKKKNTETSQDLDKKINLFDFLSIILRKVVHLILQEKKTEIKNTVNISQDAINLDHIIKVSSCKTTRSNMIIEGEEVFKEFIQNIDNNQDDNK